MGLGLRASRLRGWGVLLLGLGGAALFLRVVGKQYPIGKWLFWTYAEIWAWTLAFGAACLSSGNLLLTRLFRFTGPLRQRLPLAFAVGLFVFGTGVFVVGLLHGLRRGVFFVAWPLALAAPGAWPLARTVRRVARLLPHARRVAAAPSWTGGLALLFGVGGLALVYVNILTPGNVAFDSTWYHLAIAEHYAAAGAVTRFPEGWFCGTYPHFASLLYTWAFLLPGSDLFSRIELAAHVELLVFAATLSGIAALARLCAPGVRLRHAWAAVFLFPGIWLYDSSLSVASDHVLAFWAPPIALATAAAVRRWDARAAALAGLCMAGALLTKYQAIYLLALPSLWLAVRAVRRLAAAPAGCHLRALAPAGAWLAAVLALTAPLWLKNWIWYHAPFYPVLARQFGGRPWAPGTDPDRFLQIMSWTPQGTLPARLGETLKTAFTFSFTPHDWGNLHGSLPVFGSLFTLCLPLLFLVRPRRRALALAAAALVGVLIWYWTYHQDRYLQALVPWMAAVVAVALALCWQTAGRAGRLGVAVLVAAQVVWGGDIWAIPTHAMLKQHPLKAVMDLVSSGYRGEFEARRNPRQDLALLAPRLRRRSKVLVHERFEHLGLGAMTVTDISGTQGGIAYGALGSPRAVLELWRRYGVTHVLWSSGHTRGLETVADDLVFFETVEDQLTSRTPVIELGLTLAELPLPPPSGLPPPPDEPRVARLRLCAGARNVALAGVDAALADPAAVPEAAGAPAYLVVDTSCANATPEETAPLERIALHGKYELWLRRSR